MINNRLWLCYYKIVFEKFLDLSMSNLIKINFPSPVNFYEICIGGILQTKTGLWLPKIRLSPGTYRNIKNGVSQPTQEEARNVVVKAYYEYVGKQRNWTTQEIENRLSQGYQLMQKIEIERLAWEAEDEVRKQQERERSQANQPIAQELILDLKYFRLDKIIFPKKTTYKVQIKKVKGWSKVRNLIAQLQLGHNTQKRWCFDRLDAALNFLSFIRMQVGEEIIKQK